MSLELAKSFLIDNRMADRSQYTDDYSTTFADGTKMPMDAVFGSMQAFLKAAPDLDFNPQNWSEVGQNIRVTVSVSGTMTGTLSHPMFGEIPATGKKGQAPAEHIELTFRDGKVASMVVLEEDAPAGPPALVRAWTS